MPSYKDEERMTPTRLAKFLLKDHICRNCKWITEDLTGSTMICENRLHKSYHIGNFYPPQDHGCLLWEKDVK